MNTKRIIKITAIAIIVLLYVLMLVTTIFLVVKAGSYEPEIEDDIFGNEFDMLFMVLFSMPFIVAETDFLYNTLYFITGKKTVFKTVSNIIMCIVSALIVLLTVIATIEASMDLTLPLLFIAFIVYRMLYVLIILVKSVMK